MTQPPGVFPFPLTMAIALTSGAIEDSSVVQGVLRTAAFDIITSHAKVGPEAVLSPVLEDYAYLLFQTCADIDDLSAEEILEDAYAEAARSLAETDEEFTQAIGWVVHSFLQRRLTEQESERGTP